MAKLYELTGEYAELQDRAECGEDVSAALAALDGKLEAKAESIAAVLRNLSADQEALRAEEKRLAARRKAKENAEESLREYVRSQMVAAGITRIKCAAFSFALQNYEHVRVDDVDALPAEFRRTVPEAVEPDKKAILAAWKRDGEVVPGATVVTLPKLTER